MDHRHVGAHAAILLGFASLLHAQPQGTAKIGFLESGSQAAFAERLVAFRSGLSENGYVEGKNLSIEYRFAEGRYERLSAFARELTDNGVSVIAATGSPNAAQAALAATKSVPIVFANGGDPVKLGLVSSLNRPGGNCTGVSFFNSTLIEKRVELVRQLLPNARLIAVIVNPKNPNTPADLRQIEKAVKGFGLRPLVLNVSDASQLEPAFEQAAREHADAIFVNNDAFFSTLYKQFASLGSRSAIPAIYYLRDFVTAGALVSYGTNIAGMYREAGRYTAKILQGAKPAELPVLLPTQFEFVINLKTARALGVNVPQSVLVRADEVIE